MKKVIAGLFVFCLICALTACAGSPKNNASTENDSTTSDTSANLPEQTTSQNDKTAPTTLIGIPGSSAADILIGLEEAGGIPKGEISKAADISLNAKTCSSSTEIEGAGVSLSYHLSLDEKESITTALFSVISYQVATNEDLLEFAKSYLSYCASMPYDTADSASAQEWVKANIPNYMDAPQTTIGDATFTLAGAVQPDTNNIVELTLTITPSDIDEQTRAITNQE